MAAKVKITIFRSEPPCHECELAYRIAKMVQEEFGSDSVDVCYLSALSDKANEYGIMITPTVVVDDLLVTEGRVPHRAELSHVVRGELGGNR